MLDKMFPGESLTDTELEVIAQMLTHPTVQKYLKRIVVEDTKELLALSSIKATDREIVNAHAVTTGRLQVLGTLLSIESPTKA